MPANVVIKIGAQAAQAVSEINKVNSALGDQMTAGSKASAAIKKAAVPAALALTAISAAAIDATKAAMADQAAQEKLANQLGRVTDASTAQIAAVDGWITKQEFATGVADDELRPALGKLATATGDLGAAQKELGIALDVSAQTGKSLDSVSTALAKGYTGQTGALNKLVPGLDQATIKSKDMVAINQELATLTGGAAAEAASTAAGQYQVWTVQMQELKETLGAALIPVMEALLPLLRSGTQFVSDHAKAVQILVGIVAALAAGILIANAALKAYAAAQGVVKVATAAWTAAQWLLNAALDANPIGIVIVAVAALVAGLVVAYKTSDTFRGVVTAAMNAVKSAFQSLLGVAQSVFNWIAGHWTAASFAFGPLGVAIGQLAAHFDAVKAAASAAFGWITGAVSSVVSAINSAIAAVEGLISALGRIHVPSIHIPFLGKSALGYGFPAPPLALAGAPGARAGSSSGRYRNLGGSPIVINFYGAVDPEGTARAINRILGGHDRRQGRTL